MQQHFRITGTGGYLPQRRILAEELDRRLGLESGWTLRHTGVAVRHQRAPEENATLMGRAAALEALRAAGRSLREIDLIVDASTCQQQPIPSNAALLQEALGREAAGSAAFDVHASCLSFVVALSTVNALFAVGQHERALIVSSESALDGVNWSDPASACLMGDGAAAVVVERTSLPVAPLRYGYETFGEHAHVCEVPAGGHRVPPFAYSAQTDAAFRFRMDGPRLHRIASRYLPPLVARVLAQEGVEIGALHVVPHQASGPAVALIGRRLGLAADRWHVSLAEHGNLVAAGIPYALHRAGVSVPAGARTMLLGTAAGYSQAAMIFTR